MNGMGLIIEVVLACCFVLGFGLIELRSHRRYKKQLKDKARAADAEKQDP